MNRGSTHRLRPFSIVGNCSIGRNSRIEAGVHNHLLRATVNRHMVSGSSSCTLRDDAPDFVLTTETAIH